MTFAFFIALLAFASALRLSEYLIAEKFLARTTMTKIGTVYLFIVGFLVFALPHSHRMIWLSLYFPIFLLGGAVIIVMRRRASQFREVLCEMLTLVSLKMKSGRSFRHAIGEACAESDVRFRKQLSEIVNAVVFSQQIPLQRRHTFVDEVVSELTRIDQNPHASIKRLSVFRQKLRIENDFRRKSGQVLARIRAQSIVMTLLYFAIFAFMVCKFGWQENAPALLTSALLFAVGAVWISLGGRSMKWKV